MSLLKVIASKSGKCLLFATVLLIIAWVVPMPVFGETIELKAGQSVYQVELAATPAERRKGLMFREYLAPGEGMLLAYPDNGDHRIWMKNMQIPLRVFWIDGQHRVIDVQRVEPCSESPCPVFGAPGPSRYILELSDRDHEIRPGDSIEGLRGLP